MATKRKQPAAKGKTKPGSTTGAFARASASAMPARVGAEAAKPAAKVAKVAIPAKAASRPAKSTKPAKPSAQGARTTAKPVKTAATPKTATGKRFAFIGGFDCSPGGLDDGLLARMVENAGGVVGAEVDESLDYLVVGNRRGPSKIALSNRADKLNTAGAQITKLDETAFLELVRVDTPAASGGELDFAGFISQLYGNVNEGKLGRALDMLRKDRFKLYARLDDDRLVGVVRSQSGSGCVYASWLANDGRYGCAQPDLSECMGLQGSTCKHLLVLVCGLARTGQLSMTRALHWIRAAHNQAPRANHELCAETFIQYKGAEAGQVDWRPTETIPEDFYAI